MKNNGLRLFSDLYWPFTDNFGKSIASFFSDYNVKPSYDLVDKGDRYEMAVDYDDKRDEVNVDVNEEERTVTITVREDWDKTNGTSSCQYYGKHIETVPEDCDILAWKKEVNEKDKKMVITFPKIKNEEKEEKGFVVPDEDDKVSYEEAYKELKEEYKTTKLELVEANAKNKELEELVKIYKKENEELKEKLTGIKNKVNKLFDK